MKHKRISSVCKRNTETNAEIGNDDEIFIPEYIKCGTNRTKIVIKFISSHITFKNIVSFI